MKNIIDITKILSADLKSRYAVKDLVLYIENTEADNVVIDVKDVKFATRSFIDEYYNIVMNANFANKQVDTINIPDDIQYIFDTVKKTQHKNKSVKLDAPVIKCKTFTELRNVFSTFLL